MTSTYIDKTNWADERAPPNRRIRERVSSTPIPRMFSDSSRPFSGIPARRKNRFQEEYVGIYAGSQYPGEFDINKEPLSYQNIKFEDDNFRFIATGERKRQWNPNDRRRPNFELATQRVQRLNVFPDGYPRSGVVADLNLEKMQNEEFKNAIGQLVQDFRNLPANIAAAIPRAPGPVAYPYLAGDPSEMSFGSDLTGLFGDNKEELIQNAEQVSIRAAQERIAELQSLHDSSNFKSKARDIAKQLGITINLKDQTRDEVKDALDERLRLLERVKADRAAAAAAMASSRRGSVASIGSVESEEEKKAPAPASAPAPSGALSAVPSGVASTDAADKKIIEALNEYETINQSITGGATLASPLQTERMRELLKIVVTNSKDSSFVPSGLAEWEIPKLNAMGLALNLTNKRNAVMKELDARRAAAPAPTGILGKVKSGAKSLVGKIASSVSPPRKDKPESKEPSKLAAAPDPTKLSEQFDFIGSRADYRNKAKKDLFDELVALTNKYYHGSGDIPKEKWAGWRDAFTQKYPTAPTSKEGKEQYDSIKDTLTRLAMPPEEEEKQYYNKLATMPQDRVNSAFLAALETYLKRQPRNNDTIEMPYNKDNKATFKLQIAADGSISFKPTAKFAKVFPAQLDENSLKINFTQWVNANENISNYVEWTGPS